MSITKAELIDRIAANTEVTKADIGHVLDGLVDVATTALMEDGEVALPGIGKLKVTKRAARTGRNPKTGEAIKIAARKVVRLSVAKSLKDATA
jgi:DNA-binding protein HU-beta